MKSTGNGKFVSKYKKHIFSSLNFLKDTWLCKVPPMHLCSSLSHLPLLRAKRQVAPSKRAKDVPVLCGYESEPSAPHPTPLTATSASWHPAKGPRHRQGTVGLATTPGSQLAHTSASIWASGPLTCCLWPWPPSVMKPLYLKIKCESIWTIKKKKQKLKHCIIGLIVYSTT